MSVAPATQPSSVGPRSKRLRGRSPGATYVLGAGMLVLTVLACVLYVQRDFVLVHYHASVYLTADQSPPAIEPWLTKRPALSAPVVIAHLTKNEPAVCRRAGKLVETILDLHTDPTNPDHSHLLLSVAAKLNELYDDFSPLGRVEAVDLAAQILEKQLAVWSPTVPTALETAGEVFWAGLNDSDRRVREQSLRRLAEVWKWDGADNVTRTLVDDWKRKCYLRAVELMRSTTDSTRAAAARAVTGSTYHEGDLWLVRMLSDPDHEVRKAALLALVQAGADCLGAEHKTRVVMFLRDDDVEVRRAAQQVLRGAGITERVVQLATQITDPSPEKRAEVARQVVATKEVDPVPWLLELLEDRIATVRRSAIEAARRLDRPELRARIEKLSTSDRDPGVKEAARQALMAWLADSSS